MKPKKDTLEREAMKFLKARRWWELDDDVIEDFVLFARRHAARKLREAANLCDLPLHQIKNDDWQRGYNTACVYHRDAILALSNGAKRRRKSK